MNRKKQSTGKMAPGIPEEQLQSGYSSEVSNKNNVQPKKKAFGKEQNKCWGKKSTIIEVVIIQPRVYHSCECCKRFNKQRQTPTYERTNYQARQQQQMEDRWRRKDKIQRQYSRSYNFARDDERRSTTASRNWAQYSTTNWKEEEDRHRRMLRRN